MSFTHMKIHWFQHIDFEGLGNIEPWLRKRGHTITVTRWWNNEQPLPETLAECDWLIVMGGPMNIYQHRNYPWLPLEKEAIARVIRDGKRVLGICLGAQLIADVLGAKIMQNPEREIGWWPIHATTAYVSPEPFAFPEEINVLHWHGDTFSLPPGARLLAHSPATKHQAFAHGNRILGLQFHVEMGAAEVTKIAETCADELQGADPWVQSRETLTGNSARFVPASAELLHRLLGAMEQG